MPIITISRGSFVAGMKLALRVAERLGYPIIGREEMIHEATKEYGISVDKLVAAAKERPSIWQQVFAPRIGYLKCQTATILENVKDGNLVLHGHAGHLLLTGISHVISVRVIADIEYRIKTAMTQMSLNYKEAAEYVQRVDTERKNWTRFLYGVEWQDPGLYDQVVNLEHMSIDSACEIIVCMTKLDDFKITKESQKAFDDLLLSSRVWASLIRDSRTRVTSIQVTADSGTVTIRGSLGSEKTIDAILQVAGQVKGVLSVVNEMNIGADWYW
jgi:cytidylate kinase